MRVCSVCLCVRQTRLMWLSEWVSRLDSCDWWKLLLSLYFILYMDQSCDCYYTLSSGRLCDRGPSIVCTCFISYFSYKRKKSLRFLLFSVYIFTVKSFSIVSARGATLCATELRIRALQVLIVLGNYDSSWFLAYKAACSWTYKNKSVQNNSDTIVCTEPTFVSA